MSVKLVNEEIARFLGRADPEVLCIRLAQLCRLRCRQTTRGELGMHRQRDFLLLVTVTAAAAAPALGQTVAPAVGPSNSATQGDAAIADFSGIWARVSFPGFGR